LFDLLISLTAPLEGAQRVSPEASPVDARPNVRKPTRRKSRSMSDENQSQPMPALGRRVMAAIGQELRLMYDDIVAEGVPERFAEILRKLDEPGNEGETR
jgi:hypothetical protein